MRLVHAANFYGPRSGGLRTTLNALAEGYAAAGHDAVVLVPGEALATEPTSWGRRVTVPSRVVPGSGYRVIVDLPQVRRLLDDLAPDRLEVSDRTTLRDLGRWARERGVPSVLWAHERVDGVLASTLLRTRGGAATAVRVADVHNRRTASLFDRVVCTTSFAAEEFDRIGVPTTRVPLGVDLEGFHPRHHDASLRAELARDDEALLVLCSRLSPEKRPELALEALEVLVAGGQQCRLVVAGAGPREEALRRRFSHLPVAWSGFVADRSGLARLLATADVVVAPGPVETFGLAALEALASGTPVVATRTSALPGVVGARAGAFAAATGPALAGAVAEVLGRDPSQRRGAARERATAFPWSATVQRMIAVHTSDAVAAPAATSTPRRSARTAALVHASYARSATSPARLSRSGSGPRVVGLGDSITVGVGDLVHRGASPGWAAHVAEALQASSFANIARLGARARSVREEQLDAARACRPHVVLLSVAGNDALRGDLDVADVARCVHDVVCALVADGAAVVLLRPPSLAHVSFLPARLHRPLHTRLALVGAEVSRAASDAGAACVSLPTGRDAATQRWHVDRIHPGPGGHRWAASAALRALEPHGFSRRRPVSPVVTAPPSRLAQAGWLARHGLPWVAKRSVDLVPALLASSVTTAAVPAVLPIAGERSRRQALDKGTEACLR
jgi:alpha-1,6-mannosyltransferase